LETQSSFFLFNSIDMDNFVKWELQLLLGIDVKDNKFTSDTMKKVHSQVRLCTDLLLPRYRYKKSKDVRSTLACLRAVYGTDNVQKQGTSKPRQNGKQIRVYVYRIDTNVLVQTPPPEYSLGPNHTDPALWEKLLSWHDYVLSDKWPAFMLDITKDFVLKDFKEKQEFDVWIDSCNKNADLQRHLLRISGILPFLLLRKANQKTKKRKRVE
jgi:hypothetical protein